MKNGNTFFLTAITLVIMLTSCGKPDPSNLPIIHTPHNAKVDLSNVSLTISDAKIVRSKDNKYHLLFNYTVTNSKGAHLSFICIYRNTDELIDTKLIDQDEEPLTLGKRELEGLTLTLPRPIKILNGDTTRSLKTPINEELRESGEPITIRVRLHAPSRYDELRSTVEAAPVVIPWP